MKKTVLRLKLWIRLLTSLPLCLVVLFAGYILIPAADHLVYGSSAIVSSVIAFVFVAVVIGILFLLFSLILVWSYRIEFTETSIQLKGLFQPLLRGFNHEYPAIQEVKKGPLKGLVTITPVSGKPLHIGNNLEGGIGKVLDEIGKHVPPEKIEPDLATKIEQPTRLNKIYIWYCIICIAILPVLFAEVGWDQIRRKVAWTPYRRNKLLSSDETFMLDTDGSVWIVNDIGLSKRYEINHCDEGNCRRWRFTDTSSEFRFPIGIARGQVQEPWMIWSNSEVTHWTGDTWKTEPFPTRAQWLPEIEILGSQIWAIAELDAASKSTLYYVDLSSGATDIIPLPESTSNSKVTPRKIRLQPDGSLLVYSVGDGQKRIDVLRHNEWEAPGYLIETPAQEAIEGFSVNAKGELFVAAQGTLSNDPFAFRIGRFDPTKEVWEWFEYFHEDASDLEYIVIDELIVDAHERLWVMGSEEHKHYHADFVSVFELASTGLRQVVQYTTDNSGLQHPISRAELHMDEEGCIWIADDYLTRINTSSSDLPTPLPDWAVKVARLGASAKLPALIALYAILIVGTILVLRKMNQA